MGHGFIWLPYFYQFTGYFLVKHALLGPHWVRWFPPEHHRTKQGRTRSTRSNRSTRPNEMVVSCLGNLKTTQCCWQIFPEWHVHDMRIPAGTWCFSFTCTWLVQWDVVPYEENKLFSHPFQRRHLWSWPAALPAPQCRCRVKAPFWIPMSCSLGEMNVANPMPETIPKSSQFYGWDSNHPQSW